MLFEINDFIHHSENYSTLLLLRILNKKTHEKLSQTFIDNYLLKGRIKYYTNIDNLFNNSEFNKAFKNLTIKNSYKFLKNLHSTQFYNVIDLRICAKSDNSIDFQKLININTDTQ